MMKFPIYGKIKVMLQTTNHIELQVTRFTKDSVVIHEPEKFGQKWGESFPNPKPSFQQRREVRL